jgi:hypothetical protein
LRLLGRERGPTRCDDRRNARQGLREIEYPSTRTTYLSFRTSCLRQVQPIERASLRIDGRLG